MRNNKRLLWIGALALLALVGQPALRADDGADAAKPTTLTNPVKVKDTFQYKSTLSVSAGGADVVVEQGRKYTVKEIKDNGDIVYVVADLGGKFSINGGDMDIPPGASVTLTQDKTGKIIDYKPDANDQNPYLSDTTQYLVAMVDHIILPDKPVKPGDSWKTEAKNPAAKDKKVSIKTTFVGLDKVDGMPAWKIKQTLEAETEDGSKMTS
ncbi:MAG TPA: hypothetical protein VKU00_03040, partial [Chthonomonadaceae bacterium]|nr:hypothetical protein [Chthonomonadaceae bacterium]